MKAQIDKEGNIIIPVRFKRLRAVWGVLCSIYGFFASVVETTASIIFGIIFLLLKIAFYIAIAIRGEKIGNIFDI